MKDNSNFEVIIVGGSYAGLSAAMTLGRSLRKTLIIDGGKPCNRQTPHSHNFLTQDGKTPREISILAKQQVEQYETITFLDDLVTTGRKVDKGFEIKTQEGKTFMGEKLIFATGITDLMPDIKGFAECWGISVIHCPYCHGYEYRGQKTGIMANGDTAYHLASLVNNLTDDLTLLTSGKAEFTTEQLESLKKHEIRILESKVIAMEHRDGHLRQVVLDNGDRLDFNAVYAHVPFRQSSVIPASLGCEIAASGHLQIDDFQKTSVEGVFACGDNSSYFRSVTNAVASGNFTGAFLNKELTEERF